MVPRDHGDAAVPRVRRSAVVDGACGGQRALARGGRGVRNGSRPIYQPRAFHARPRGAADRDAALREHGCGARSYLLHPDPRAPRAWAVRVGGLHHARRQDAGTGLRIGGPLSRAARGATCARPRVDVDANRVARAGHLTHRCRRLSGYCGLHPVPRQRDARGSRRRVALRRLAADTVGARNLRGLAGRRRLRGDVGRPALVAPPADRASLLEATRRHR